MRSCGECTACCVYQPIPELEKGPFCACPKLASGTPAVVLRQGDGMPCMASEHYRLEGQANCSDYDHRPEGCRSYQCEWRLGAGGEGDRPDRCGILVDRLLRNELTYGVVAKPLWLDAQNSDEAKAAMERISHEVGEPMLVAEFAEQRVLYLIGRGA